MFVGGPLGNGKQWFPWIQIEDLLDAIQYVVDNNVIDGPVNFCSPNPIRNSEFSNALANQLGRPGFFHVPAFILKIVAGELGSLVLNSQHALPTVLSAHGFNFSYPEISEAIIASLT